MASHDDELCVALTRMALAGDGVVLGIGMTILATKTWLKYKSHLQALQAVQATPLTQIADLRTLITKDHDQAQVVGDFNIVRLVLTFV
jgi:E3 ubiquitin-protein ligase MUL1